MIFHGIFHGMYCGLMESNGIYPAWLWLLQFAMEAMVHRNRWLDGLPFLKTSIYFWGFSMAMLNNQRVIFIWRIGTYMEKIWKTETIFLGLSFFLGGNINMDMFFKTSVFLGGERGGKHVKPLHMLMLGKKWSFGSRKLDGHPGCLSGHSQDFQENTCSYPSNTQSHHLRVITYYDRHYMSSSLIHPNICSD